jgi:hypothetical protein
VFVRIQAEKHRNPPSLPVLLANTLAYELGSTVSVPHSQSLASSRWPSDVKSPWSGVTSDASMNFIASGDAKPPSAPSVPNVKASPAFSSLAEWPTGIASCQCETGSATARARSRRPLARRHRSSSISRAGPSSPRPWWRCPRTAGSSLPEGCSRCTRLAGAEAGRADLFHHTQCRFPSALRDRAKSSATRRVTAGNPSRVDAARWSIPLSAVAR